MFVVLVHFSIKNGQSFTQDKVKVGYNLERREYDLIVSSTMAHDMK